MSARNYRTTQGGTVRRYILPIAAVLLTAACSGGTSRTASASSPTSSKSAATPKVAATRSHPATTHASSAPRKAKPKPSSSTKDCPPTRDIIVWVKAPGASAYAQELGDYNLETCESTFKWLQRTSPTDAGNCTEAAWASDNRGYNTDADPAPRLKKVQMFVGPAC